MYLLLNNIFAIYSSILIKYYTYKNSKKKIMLYARETWQNDEKVVSKKAEWSSKELVLRQAEPDDHRKKCGFCSDFNEKLLNIVKERNIIPHRLFRT